MTHFSPGRLFLLFALGVVLHTPAPIFADKPVDLAIGLKPLASVVAGREPKFDLSGKIRLVIDGKSQAIDVSVVRYDEESFDLVLTHPEYAVTIRRRADITALALPKHGTVFIGRGEVESDDSLKPMAITERLISQSSSLSQIQLATSLLPPATSKVCCST